MGRPPAVVIVVRHGARLDAADKNWHLTSPTPYDPPLTYGGWTQSKALGARIANILRTRETDDELLAGEQNGAGKKRRHKVVIHTSPFLRCVQTSVAISAGLAQNPGHTPAAAGSRTPGSPAIKPSQIHGSPRIRPLITTNSPSLAPILEPSKAVKLAGKPNGQPDNIRKSAVRVDAFLGEWLSPDYFEHITPPPSSIMMVAGAKADLLRREDYSSLTHTPSAHNQGFPGGWGSPVVAPLRDNDEGPLSTLSSLAQTLPRRDRTSSMSSAGSHGSRHAHRSTTPVPSSLGEHGTYQPPIPNHAISPAEPIPAGYVAHARDACVNVDYQWDSMREPQNWGDGGEYGEEWSAMHRRFRKGLQQLIGWYNESDDPGKLMTKTPAGTSEDDNADEEDTDLVVILVTHGAGCNALIGALTNQPALLDVGMSSLTMAVRKPALVSSPGTTPGHSPNHSRSSSRVPTVADEYDVKLVANTEHLRTNSQTSTPSSSRAPSLAGIAPFRERYVSNGGGGSVDSVRNRPMPQSGNFGSIRRAASIAGQGPRSYTPVRQSSIGLWTAPQTDEDEAVDEPEDDMILNFGDDGTAAETATRENENENTPLQKIVSRVSEKEEEKDEADDVAPLGLWGAPRPPGIAEKIREISTPKRRWTVSERG